VFSHSLHPLLTFRSRSLSNVVAAETLIARCHRGRLWGCLREFVFHRLRQMERYGYLARTNDWWDWESCIA
jgi:hypothetical protein